jgi:hypothetical protein
MTRVRAAEVCEGTNNLSKKMKKTSTIKRLLKTQEPFGVFMPDATTNFRVRLPSWPPSFSFSLPPGRGPSSVSFPSIAHPSLEKKRYARYA